MRKKIYRILGRFRQFFYEPVLLKFTSNHDAILDSRVDEIKSRIALTMPDNLILKGYKCYSAGEEDGMIEAIFNVIEPSSKMFIEIGCEKGLENNTHFLLLNKWKGLWVDGNDKFIHSITSFLGADRFDNLLVKHAFVTKENVCKIFNEAVEFSMPIFSQRLYA